MTSSYLLSPPIHSSLLRVEQAKYKPAYQITLMKEVSHLSARTHACTHTWKRYICVSFAVGIGYFCALCLSAKPQAFFLCTQVPVPNTRNFSMFGSSLESVTVVRGGKALQTPSAPTVLSSTPPATLPLPLPTNGPTQASSIVVQPVMPGKSLSNNSASGTTAVAGGSTPTAERKVSGSWFWMRCCPIWVGFVLPCCEMQMEICWPSPWHWLPWWQ